MMDEAMMSGEVFWGMGLVGLLFSALAVLALAAYVVG
jgi:hypothetical protein